MDPVAVVVLAAYVSLLVELVVFPIPSEASVFQLFFRGGEELSDPQLSLDRARSRSALAKTLRYLLPTGLGVALFLIPLAVLAWPGLFDALVPLEALQTDGWVAAGLTLVVVGRVLTFASVLQLRRHKRDASLGSGGLFERSRNPGLVGMFLWYLGNALVFPCVVLLVGMVPYVLNMHRRVLMEEEHLERSLGPEYRSYLERVPRYIRLHDVWNRR